MKRRISRKSKKWHKKNGYVTHWLPNGKAYWTRTYRIAPAGYFKFFVTKP